MSYFEMAQCGEMPTPEEASRAYLEAALDAAGLDMKAASEAIERNPTYLQQYIKYGKPQWLKEHDREALEKLVPDLDGSKLKPPAKPLKRPEVRAEGSEKIKVDPPRYGQFVDDPGTLELLDIWSRLTDDSQRSIAKDILRIMANAAKPVAA